MTLAKYKTLDIIILTAFGLVADLVAWFFLGQLSKAFLANVYMIPSIAFLTIIYIRWKRIGIIPNIILLGVNLLLYGNTLALGFWDPGLIVGFILGYLSLFAMVFWTKYNKNAKIASGIKMILLYVILPFGLMILLQAGAAFAFDHVNGMGRLLRVVIQIGLLNLLIYISVMIIASFQKNLLVDMKQYLILKEKEKEER